jgi:TP901 family phage tail tape measure protein
MADENIVTNIVANADFSGLIADVNKVAASLSKLQAQIIQSDARLASQVATMNRSFGENLRRTGQFATHFVTLTSDVEKFGTNLDKGQMKLKQYFQTFQQHTKTQGGLIRDLAKQQVALQNAIIQPMGKNAQGLMQYSVHIPQGLDAVKNKAAIARQELQIMNKVIQDGGVQMINWGKNTQWAGRQLTVGLTVPLAAFGKAAADAFRMADAELVRLTKVYGGVAATSAADLSKIRNEVTATAKELSKTYGVSFKDTITLAADIAATGKQGNELLASVKETSRLAVLGEVDRQDAMKATLAIQTTFKQNTDQLSESINFLNSVENQTSTSLADLIEAIPKAGPVIQGMGGSVKDLALYLTAMKEGGINAAEGANALKSALASLINPTKVATEKFQGMGIDLGGIVTKNAGNLTGTILELQKALDNLDPLQKQQAIEQLFGKFQFARMNALFSNLGKQGSQTLQVMDLMKASSQELAGVAGRELSMVTESASGKYRRALEGLKADLAGMGEEFLKIQTFFINVTDSIVKFVSNLPGPIKTILTFVTGLTAIIGPVIMLTGVLANFFGYIIKGASHFKSLFKGGEGWKMLTPEILAAQKAGSLVEATFYSDAKAATVLKTAIAGLVTEFELLQNKAMTGAVSVGPTLSTMAGNIVTPGGGRVVNPNHPLISAEDTRSMSHLNPVAGMSTDAKAAQTIFGVVPGAPKVNQKIGNNPQMYMSGDLPKIPGLTSIGGASTGIVAAEAAKWHAMTGALAMQSASEIELLKKEVLSTGLITTELSDSYQALLPTMTKLTANAATESAAIVAQLQAGKLTVDQARLKIIELNAQVETMIAQASTDIAGQQGRSIGLTTVPLLNQPVVNKDGKTNMKELTRPGRTRDLLNKIARNLGVKTFGAGYSTETTMPKRMATGGKLSGPGNGTSDSIPIMASNGEFIVKADAVNNETLPFLQALNETGSTKPFLSATMIHQGAEANQALAGNRPGVNLTGNYLANDMSSLHSRGLHPMAIFYEQGIRLGYDKVDLNRALNSAYTELEGSFRRKGDAPINNAYYEKVATSVAMKHLKTVSRFSPRVGRNVRMAEEILFLGHQRNSQNKGIEPGSLRTTGFDGVEMPRHLVGTGSGFSGAANQTHFNLAQELYDEKPSNLYTGPLGRGNTLSQVFNSQRGHIGAKFAPSKWNLLLNMIRSKIGRAPVVQDARSIALNQKWRKGYANGGLVGSMVPGYAKGGIISSAFQGARQEGFLGQGAFNTARTGGLSSPMAGMGIGMGMQGAGAMMGGQAGTILQVASILPMISMTPLVKLTQAITGMGGALTKAGGAGKALELILKNAFKAGPLLILSGVIAGITIGVKKWTTEIAENRREQTLLNGITKKGAAEAGIAYNNLSESIKGVRDQLELARAGQLDTFNSQNMTGIKGITLSIKELQEKIAAAKTSMPEFVNTLNGLSKSQEDNKKTTIDMAQNWKAQFIAGGMSVSEATNEIYAIIKASDMANLAFEAISNKGFQQIQDKATSASYMFKQLSKNMNNLVGEDLGNALGNVVIGVDSAVKSLVGTTDINGEVITQQKAIETVMNKLNVKGEENKALLWSQIESLKETHPELYKILNTTDTIKSTIAKWKILVADVNINLKALTATEAEALAKFLELQDAAIAAAESGKVGAKGGIDSLAKSGTLISKLNKQILAGGKDAEKAAIRTKDQIDAEIKAIDKRIKKIQEEADARIKAIQKTQSAESYAVELKQAQLDLQAAIASGDKEAQARATLSLSALQKRRQSEMAISAIQDDAAAKTKALEEEKTKKQNEIDALNKKLVTAQTRAADVTVVRDKVQGYQSSYEALVKRQGINSEKLKSTPNDKAALAEQVAIGKAFTNLANAAATDIKGKDKDLANAIKEAFTGTLVKENGASMGGKFMPATHPKGSATWKGPDVSVLNSDAAKITDIIGKSNIILGEIRNILANQSGGKRNINIKDTDIQAFRKQGLTEKQIFKDNGDLDDAIRTQIISKNSLKKNDTFDYKGVTYRVTGSGFLDTGAVRVTPRALGGPVVAGQTYAVNDRINPLGFQQEGFTPFTPRVSGMIHANAATMPRYDIPSGGYRGSSNMSSAVSGGAAPVINNYITATPNMDIKQLAREVGMVTAKAVSRGGNNRGYSNGTQQVVNI